VLTHGNSYCAGVWTPLMAALAGDRYTVVALDLAGQGWSDKPDTGYDWASLRDDLVELVTTLDLRDILHVGHSRGGGVSLLAAAATPDRIRGVWVYEPTVPVQPGPSGEPAPVPQPARIEAVIERTLKRREVFASRDELIARYRAQDAFREWREDYFQAFIAYGSVVREDGSVELCVPPRAAVRLYEATFGFDGWRGVHAPICPCSCSTASAVVGSARGTTR
jgi:pimeloyl-ACP methyl ester carboxylesterase